MTPFGCWMDSIVNIEPTARHIQAAGHTHVAPAVAAVCAEADHETCRSLSAVHCSVYLLHTEHVVARHTAAPQHALCKLLLIVATHSHSCCLRILSSRHNAGYSCCDVMSVPAVTHCSSMLRAAAMAELAVPRLSCTSADWLRSRMLLTRVPPAA